MNTDPNMVRLKKEIKQHTSRAALLLCQLHETCGEPDQKVYEQTQDLENLLKKMPGCEHLAQNISKALNKAPLVSGQQKTAFLASFSASSSYGPSM